MHGRLAATGFLWLAVFLAGCSGDGGQVAPPADANVHVHVSNQSFDDPTADLLVTLDGEALFDGEAKVEDQHNWMLREAKVAAGTHTLSAFERDTGTRATEEFVLPQGQELWLVVDYWNPLREGEGPGFTISVHEQAVSFD